MLEDISSWYTFFSHHAFIFTSKKVNRSVGSAESNKNLHRSIISESYENRYILYVVCIINVLNVVYLEDGTLVWYDQSTEGIALTMFYLHFIPPSPYNEAGQDRRNILFEGRYLPVTGGGCQIYGPNFQAQYTSWKMARCDYSSCIGFLSTHFIQLFQPCWAWIPFTVFPDRMYHHELQTLDPIS